MLRRIHASAIERMETAIELVYMVGALPAIGIIALYFLNH